MKATATITAFAATLSVVHGHCEYIIQSTSENAKNADEGVLGLRCLVSGGVEWGVVSSAAIYPVKKSFIFPAYEISDLSTGVRSARSKSSEHL